MAGGQSYGGGCGLDAFGDHTHSGQDFDEGFALAELITDGAIAAEFAVAGEDEVAQTTSPESVRALPPAATASR